MPVTKKLYYEDSFLFQFDACVLACELKGDVWAVVLDRTAFYPEGGGQPADTGTLGEARVLDVHEAGGSIAHTTDAPLPVGMRVEGRVDARRRLDHMQQHTGEHILSGLLHSLYGADNVGFHIGPDTVRMDMSLELTAQQLADAELAANQVVWQDVPVQCAWPGPEQLADAEYRSKKVLDGPVRLVTVPGADCCACCGTHLYTTGQVGAIKILSSQNYKGGVRLTVACGGRALADHAQKCTAAAEISAALSAAPAALPQAVRRVLDENAQLKYQLIHTEDRLFAAMAERVAPGDAPCLLCEGLGPDALRRLCLALCTRTQGLCAVFSPSPAGLAYALGSAQGDVRGVCKALNAACGGRGGGKPGLAQGSIQAGFEEARRILQEYKE